MCKALLTPIASGITELAQAFVEGNVGDFEVDGVPVSLDYMEMEEYSRGDFRFAALPRPEPAARAEPAVRRARHPGPATVGSTVFRRERGRDRGDRGDRGDRSREERTAAR